MPMVPPDRQNVDTASRLYIYFTLYVHNHNYPFKEKLLYIIQNVYKTIFWLNEKLMQHTECYTERFGYGCHMSDQKLPFINGGTTLNINIYEKVNRSLPK